MRNEAKGQPSQEEAKTGSNARGGAASAPTLSLPKGGGAIRGIGEKFAANPVTGTGSMTAPIAISPGRAGFGPQLALTYDSGSGNGLFGFGWNLSLPSITRKTDKGIPRYEDALESDVFILSGAEDLVPTFRRDERGAWLRDVKGDLIIDEGPRDGYMVRRYRPRVEGLFARIERWTNVATGETHWRSISRDNVTTLYGKNNNSRIFDPSDPDPERPTRIFSWLISESYDDKGNAIVFEYKEEDTGNVNLSQAHERNRTPASRSANRYLKRIKYGNRISRLVEPDPSPADWMFEVVFDYGEGHYAELDPVRLPPDQRRFVRAATVPASTWPVRQDPFSTYRAGFEARAYRLCRRVLMFHHFADELGIEDCLARSTDFTYAESPVASFMTSVTHSGYVHQRDDAHEDRYLKRSLPPLEFEYSRALTAEELARQPIQEVDAESLENLPAGLGGANYQWVDLDGEGIPGALTEQPGAWYYKRNLSPFTDEGDERAPVARFAPLERIARIPTSAISGSGRQQFLDLAGDGRLDLVELAGPTPGFYERTDDADWSPFRPFASLPGLDWNDPNLRFIDLTGDGQADVLVTQDEVLTWYPSLAEAGFGPARKSHQTLDGEKGPRLVFADGAQSIYLADLSGDGLTDLARIRNGEVCYWPNLGYGRFGAKVTMDNAPWFDATDQFDQKRIRLADTDGSGATDILYLRRDGVQIYFNQSGNRWSEAVAAPQFPAIDDMASVQALDLLGNGTACLVWSSPLQKDAARPMRYIDLMGGRKPHLLVKSVNNLGAETHVHYAPSTKFYLADKLAGKPWLTRLPFPVHVVERVETLDRISRNRFVTRSAYHHGYFDGAEREFRGFGMVEQWDTEELAALNTVGALPETTNIDESSYVPPVYTKTWFHTGAWFEEARISRQFEDEYYREGDESEDLEGLTDEQLKAMLLPDTVPPSTLKRRDGSSVPCDFSTPEVREAYRALKGSILRREVYALDGADAADRPYSVTEQNYTIEMLQPRAGQRHAVFLTHARESVDYHYERRLYEVGSRRLADPRVTHAVTLEVDGFGNALKSVAIGYGRRFDALEESPSLLTPEDRRKQRQTLVTLTENRFTNAVEEQDDYRTPALCEARTFEALNLVPDSSIADITNLFRFDELQSKLAFPADGSRDLLYEDFTGRGVTTSRVYRRLIEHVRTLYRRNDLTDLLPIGQLESLALPGEAYQLAFTPGLLGIVFQRRQGSEPVENLLPNPSEVLSGSGSDRGGYVDLDGDGHWWIPSGRVFYHVDAAAHAAQELAEARRHFFLPRRFRDPFNQNTTVTYDARDLSLRETRDALGNTMQSENDYRVLQPWLITDPNGNRSAVEFDVLGMVACTAVMGKAGENQGDSLTGFVPDFIAAELAVFVADPRAQAASLLGNATTRIVYDLDRFKRSGRPPFAATLARETHVNDLPSDQQSKIQVSFSYSDGFGREIQKKLQAEPGPLVEGGPIANLRWVGSGWTIFNNKGKPVRQYEPFFDDTHDFKFARTEGLSPILFYDPLERVVATLHPNHTWEKVVFDPWRQETWDVNDTLLLDPRTDEDVRDFFLRLPDADCLPGWYAQRITGEMGGAERDAATKAAAHANTPTVAHLDSLGRTFITTADNGGAEKYATGVEYDIEGNQRAVIDARNVRVLEQDFDMLGHALHTRSVDAGERWMLSDAAGKAIRAWDSRGHAKRMRYDALRRPTHLFVQQERGAEILAERLVYGEDHPDAVAFNLRGELFQQYDGAGVVTQARYDFKCNLLRSTRQFAVEYRRQLDWSASAPPVLQDETFTSGTTYDALNRPVAQTMPDRSVIRPAFNEANLLERVAVNLRGSATETVFVSDIDYDAKGQRELIEYRIADAAGVDRVVRTEYAYDPLTFRLTHLTTTRTTDGRRLQDLSYTYDPAGNITAIRDDAQQTIYFRNRIVEPSAEYEYDALYRLISAIGREHLGQNAAGLSAPRQTDHDDSFRTNLPHPGDGNAMGRYTERYEYDAVGNILRMTHEAGPAGGWTRRYAYAADSNRLLSSSLPGDRSDWPYSARYEYDEHGNMTMMSHLPTMEWDFKDQLRVARKQVAPDGGTGETAYYVYDSAGQRARKVIERPGGSIKNDRIYLGGFEIYRERSNGNITLERETLHVMDSQHRIALVETRSVDVEARPFTLAPLTRYQLNNHLGSAIVELDGAGAIISYEEYYPYGNTSYQAVRSGVEASAKRYRYIGMERDQESGLAYHSARYYAPWLGRWTSADPLGLIDGPNLYRYARSNPVRLSDKKGTQTLEQQFCAVQNEINIDRLGYETTRHIHNERPPGATQSLLQDVRDWQNMGTNTPINPQSELGRRMATMTSALERASQRFRTYAQRLQTMLNEAGSRIAGIRSAIDDPSRDPRDRRLMQTDLREAQDELRRMEGPIQNEIQALREDINVLEQARRNLGLRELPAILGRSSRGSSPPYGAPPPSGGRPPTSPTPSRLPARGAEAPAPGVRPNQGGASTRGLIDRALTSRATTSVGRGASHIARGIGFLATVSGAHHEASQVRSLFDNSVYGSIAGGLNATATFILGVGAGAIDDAIFALSPMHVIHSWETHESGPVQHVLGVAVRAWLRWNPW